jgi:hypothetical protein
VALSACELSHGLLERDRDRSEEEVAAVGEEVLAKAAYKHFASLRQEGRVDRTADCLGHADIAQGLDESRPQLVGLVAVACREAGAHA